MTTLFERPPYSPRDDAVFLADMLALTEFHRAACAPYTALLRDWNGAKAVHELPFVHVGLFKQMELRSEHATIRHHRVLKSSATTSGTSSRISLDDESSRRQGESVRAILSDFVGASPRPLLVLDDPRALRDGSELSARLAAALSLRAIASDLRFVMQPTNGTLTTRWTAIKQALETAPEVLVYGFTTMLWTAWAHGGMPPDVAALLATRRVTFVHSGGWKKLEAERVPREMFERELLAATGPGSQVLDYYGLVEQVGIVYPLCGGGARHVPVWADVIVRDSFTLDPLAGAEGQLQLLNTLPLGAPYHSVLTEDIGRMLPGPCSCGRVGRRFELLGRVPNAEIRGCANV